MPKTHIKHQKTTTKKYHDKKTNINYNNQYHILILLGVLNL